MKSLSKLFMACGLIVGLAACNKELAPEQGNLPNASKETMKMAFNISMPMTRSTTDGTGNTPSNAKPDDFEIGKAAENAVKTVQLVLVDPESHNVKAISYPGSKEGEKWTPSNSQDPTQTTYVCRFDSEQLMDASANGPMDLEIYAFINNNYLDETAGFESALNKPFNPNKIINTKETDIANAAKGFVMSNAEPRRFTLPEQTELIAKYKDQAMNIGTIPVERLTARFDVSTEKLDFQIEGQPFQVLFTEVGLSNVSYKTYALRRTNSTGIATNDFVGLLGMETVNNYICDVDAARKDELAVEPKPEDPIKGLTPEQEAELFVEVTPKYTALASLKDSDNWNSNPGKYLIWRYATENVLPAPQKRQNNQFENLTTNVSFKGQLQQIGTHPIAAVDAAFKAGDVLYVFENTLLGNQKTVERAAKGWPKDENKTPEQLLADPTIEHYELNGALTAAYAGIEARMNPTPESGLKAETFEEAAGHEGFKIFKQDETGVYPIYYLYGNKHNNNGDPKVSGPMEYAVVRNNVYKLKIAKVYSFGDPTFVKGQPEEWEKSKAAFEVYVAVLPWTVRENNIEF